MTPVTRQQILVVCEMLIFWDDGGDDDDDAALEYIYKCCLQINNFTAIHSKNELYNNTNINNNNNNNDRLVLFRVVDRVTRSQLTNGGTKSMLIMLTWDNNIKFCHNINLYSRDIKK